MVRYQGQNEPLPAKGSYSYDQKTSLWDAVLTKELPGSTSNDRSFEKSDLKPQEQKAVKKMMAAKEMNEEKKCSDEDLIVSKEEVGEGLTAASPSCSATEETEEEVESCIDDEDEYAQTSSATEYEAPNLPEDEVQEKIESIADSKEEVNDEEPAETAEEEAPESKPEVNDSQPTTEEHPLLEKLKAAGKPEPEILSQLMAQMVSDAAKKELESRLQQQQQLEQQLQEEQQQMEQQQQAKEEEPATMEELSQIENSELTLVDSTPMDAEALAKAQARLMEQAKSLAKAQAMIQAQAKALARLEQQQQQQMRASPPVSPASNTSQKSPSRVSPASNTSQKSPSSASPNRPKPMSVRAPSDEIGTASPASPPTSAAGLAAMLAMPAANEPQSLQRKSTDRTHSPSSDTTEVTQNTKSPSRKERQNEILSVLDGEWLTQAKSEAQAKAQALIETAKAEAAARAQARKEAKEKALAEEKARLKAEAEAQIKAKAVQDAWQFEQTRAAFRAEEKAKEKAKAAAKAAAEDKLRRKADTDQATTNVLDAQRAQLKAEAEYKMRKKAAMDARFLAECKARRMAEARSRQEAMTKAKMQQEEKAAAAKVEAERQKKIQEMADAQARANAEHNRRLHQKAMEAAKVEEERQASLAKKEAERQQVLKEMAAAQAKADAEHKLRLKAEKDAKWLAECKARRMAEAEARQRAIVKAEAEAKVRAKMAEAGDAVAEDSQKSQGILSSIAGAQSWAAAKKLLLEPPKEFVPFGKSKGEEIEDKIRLYLQMPGVVHVSEVKVELEDGVLYISRGIILEGVEGVQKYTRSFPFEEELLDTNRISVTLVPANATADGISVLQFTLPKTQSTWKIPMRLSTEEGEEEEPVKAEEEEEPAKAEEKEDMEDMTEVSLDAPDDEVSLAHPSDEMKASKTTGDSSGSEDAAATQGAAVNETAENKASAPNTGSLPIEDKNGFRILSLVVPTGLALNDISAIFAEDSVRVAGHDGLRLSFRHVVLMNSQEVEVRQLEGSYDPETGKLVIKAPLRGHHSVSKPRSRRIKVVKMEEMSDNSGIISLFNDDLSLSSRGSQSNTNPTTPERKKGMKVASIKSIASKYLRLKPKKQKHEVP